MNACGHKHFELTNLPIAIGMGNVLVVITDQKHATCQADTVTHYTAQVTSATDYSPFGAPLAGRTWYGDTSGGYRYGFNGMERDNQTYGVGNAYDFGARIYDSRLGRWLSVDPLYKEYPSLSTYCSMGNSPVYIVDKDGRKIIVYSKADQETVLKLINSKAIGEFAFNENGELYLKQAQSPKDEKSPMSRYYSDRLIEAINDQQNMIVIDIEPHYLDPEDGKIKLLDDPNNGGGGITLPEIQSSIDPISGKKTEKKVAMVVISGNANTSDIQDQAGFPLIYNPDDILMHEMLGHAIPFIAGEDTGNAIKNENKAREQIGDKLRKEEPNHEE